MNRHLITLGIFYGPIGLYCICQLQKTRILLMCMFIKGLTLNYISKIRWILKFCTSNTNL